MVDPIIDAILLVGDSRVGESIPAVESCSGTESNWKDGALSSISWFDCSFIGLRLPSNPIFTSEISIGVEPEWAEEEIVS